MDTTFEMENKPEFLPPKKTKLSGAARLGLQIMTGREFTEATEVPNRFTWQSPQLKEFTSDIVTNPKVEWDIILGRGATPVLDGSDCSIISGDEHFVPDQEKSPIRPLIDIHYHPVPFIPHEGDLAQGKKRRRDLQTWEQTVKEALTHYVGYNPDVKKPNRPQGIVGVLYPTGISDLLWMDIFLSPEIIGHSIHDRTLTDVFLSLLSNISHAPKEYINSYFEEVKAILGKTLHEISLKDGEKSLDMFSIYNKLKREGVGAVCRALGIVHYRGTVTMEDMKKGIEGITFERLTD